MTIHRVRCFSIEKRFRIRPEVIPSFVQIRKILIYGAEKQIVKLRLKFSPLDLERASLVSSFELARESDFELFWRKLECKLSSLLEMKPRLHVAMASPVLLHKF